MCVHFMGSRVYGWLIIYKGLSFAYVFICVNWWFTHVNVMQNDGYEFFKLEGMLCYTYHICFSYVPVIYEFLLFQKFHFEFSFFHFVLSITKPCVTLIHQSYSVWTCLLVNGWMKFDPAIFDFDIFLDSFWIFF
jgi:hypothetical protein